MQLERKQRTILILGVVVLLLVIANSFVFFFRADLTAGGAYTISDTSRKILTDLKAPVQINYYLSGKLKSRSPTFQQIEDFLYEYARVSRGNVQITVTNPEGKEQQLGLDQKGIAPKQLTQSDKTQVSQALVYSGIQVNYLSEAKTLPFIDDPGSIEYQLDAMILQLDKKKNLVLGLMAPSGNDINVQYTILKQQLGQLYEVRELQPTQAVDQSVEVLFVFKPETITKEILKTIDQFIMSGKGVMIAADPINVSLQGSTVFGMAAPDNPSDAMLSAYGLTVEKSLIADKYSNAFPVTQMAGEMRYQQMVPYPYWPSIGPDGAQSSNPITSNFQGLDLYWASPIRVASGVSAEVLVASSSNSITVKDQFELDPMQAQANYQISQEPKKSQPVVVLRTGKMNSAFVADKPAITTTDNARLIVVGDAEFGSDLIQATNAVQNLYFLKNVLEYLGNDEALMKLRNREVAAPQLNKIKNVDTKNGIASMAWILNVIVVPAAVIAFGVIRALRRRKASEKGNV
jgi:gliding-associated putative ABC transporter substrate-binding component GldG